MSNRPFKARNAFHPADPPHGMQNYDVGALMRDQKQALNKMKMTTRKENEIYFKSHSEIRGLIGILLRHVLSKQPLIDIHEVVGTFFNRPRREIVADLLDYLSSADKRSDVTDDLRREIFRTANFETRSSNDLDSQSHCSSCDCMQPHECDSSSQRCETHSSNDSHSQSDSNLCNCNRTDVTRNFQY
ncbi:PREDICTED: uncharacterized protein LOC108773549 [Cyphomyrmex costatus]|uniref:Uncharacterized protein n=1 Tax=Cyphomyrmex costatus TaxID=456900 RepID=A0A195CSZ6_9HYME|nr:PREDICTED: uncharacterized protein LOC108773549 [Cyphomyrmex costatus]KYN03249.1 hypothetical protein ALC62_05912 [Cyphomyrmex costatus]